MNFKLKTLVAMLALSAAAATSANAATTQAGANGSSMIFSAWDSVALTSYSFDLGNYLNTFLGADTISGSMLSGTNKTGNTNNTLTASNTIFTGTVADIKLTGFNLSGANVQWNLAGADGVGRGRLLVSESGSLAGLTNSEITTATGGVGTYIGFGAAASTVTGTTGTSSDAWYANSSSWGDTLGPTGFSGTSNVLGGVSNIVAAWQQSTLAGQAGSAAGFANMTNSLGQVFTATTYTVGADTFLRVAAVPEADTSGMMLAGLGLMGFIARRRNRKQA